jgi:hypothetical protein
MLPMAEVGRICYNMQVFRDSMRLPFQIAGGFVRLLAGVLTCAIAFPAIAVAQNPPLADVARKEAERRKGIKQTQKVITTKDLPESARKPASAPAAPAGAEQPAASGAQKPAAAEAAKPAGDATKDEKYWRDRLATAQENLRRNEAFADALQTRINTLATDFANRDDPYQRARIGEDRQKAIAELGRVKNDVEQSKKQIADIEEEARKAGVPPGWLR